MKRFTAITPPGCHGSTIARSTHLIPENSRRPMIPNMRICKTTSHETSVVGRSISKRRRRVRKLGCGSKGSCYSPTCMRRRKHAMYLNITTLPRHSTKRHILILLRSTTLECYRYRRRKSPLISTTSSTRQKKREVDRHRSSRDNRCIRRRTCRLRHRLRSWGSSGEVIRVKHESIV